MTCPECPHCRLISSIRGPKEFTGGQPPYGFVAHGKNFEFHEFNHGPTLARILVAHGRGMTTRQIAQSLNAQGIKAPAGGEWSHGIVARVIRQGKKLSHLIPLEYLLED